MKKRRAYYIHKDSGEIKQYVKGRQPAGWEYLPPMARWIDDDGKFHLRVQFEDATVEIIEQDDPSIIEGEVVEKAVTANVDKNTV